MLIVRTSVHPLCFPASSPLASTCKFCISSKSWKMTCHWPSRAAAFATAPKVTGEISFDCHCISCKLRKPVTRIWIVSLSFTLAVWKTSSQVKHTKEQVTKRAKHISKCSKGVATCRILNMATRIRIYPIQQYQLLLYASCSNWTAWRHSAEVMAAVKAMGFGAIARCGISANSDMLDCHILVLRYAATGCLWLVGHPVWWKSWIQFIAIHPNFVSMNSSKQQKPKNALKSFVKKPGCSWGLDLFYDISSTSNKSQQTQLERERICRVLPFSTELMAALKVTTSGSKPCIDMLPSPSPPFKQRKELTKEMTKVFSKDIQSQFCIKELHFSEKVLYASEM